MCCSECFRVFFILNSIFNTHIRRMVEGNVFTGMRLCTGGYGRGGRDRGGREIPGQARVPSLPSLSSPITHSPPPPPDQDRGTPSHQDQDGCAAMGRCVGGGQVSRFFAGGFRSLNRFIIKPERVKNELMLLPKMFLLFCSPVYWDNPA